MKTLQAFWHWVDGEKPSADTLGERFSNSDALSESARTALDLSARAIARRLRLFDPDAMRCLDVIDDQRAALCDLSLAFCEALERMHEQVDTPEPGAFADKWLEQMYPGPDRVLEAFQKAEALLVPSPEWVEAMVDDQIVPMRPETFASLRKRMAATAERAVDDAHARDVERLKFEDMYRTMPFNETADGLAVVCPQCHSDHTSFESMLVCEARETGKAISDVVAGYAKVPADLDLAALGRWVLNGYQDPQPDPCERCGNPKHLHYPYPSEVGSCVPRVPGQFEPVHGKSPRRTS